MKTIGKTKEALIKESEGQAEEEEAARQAAFGDVPGNIENTKQNKEFMKKLMTPSSKVRKNINFKMWI